MAYADYTYYTDTYFGFKVPSEKFNFYSERASEKLDCLVNIEISATILTTYETEIKKCVCAITDIMYQEDKDDGKYISSEKVLTHQVNYGSRVGISREQTEGQKIYQVTVTYLGKTGLLFGGLNKHVN
jgi:hypothetical protein